MGMLKAMMARMMKSLAKSDEVKELAVLINKRIDNIDAGVTQVQGGRREGERESQQRRGELQRVQAEARGGDARYSGQRRGSTSNKVIVERSGELHRSATGNMAGPSMYEAGAPTAARPPRSSPAPRQTT